MTLGEMRTYVATLVDDPRMTYFTTAVLDQFINKATGECQKKLNAAGNNWYTLQTPDSGAGSYQTIVNQKSYAMPTDFQDIMRIELVQNPGVNESRWELEPMTLNDQGMYPPYSQTPGGYFLQQSDLILVPIPQSAIYTIRIWYTRPFVPAANIADIIDAPIQFLEYIAYLSAIKCFIKDTRDASLLKAENEETEKRLEKAAIQRQKQRPRKVRVRDGLNGGGFYY